MAQLRDLETTNLARRATSGGVLLAAGLVMLFFAWGYPVGTLQQMGPGFIPRTIGILICCLAIGIIVVDLNAPESARAGALHWRGLIFISAAITIFAVLVEVAGLVPSMFLAVAVSMIADNHSRLLTVLIYAICATAAGWLLFLVALELPIPAFWR